MKDRPYVEILDYQTFVPDEIELPSLPVHMGSLPDTNTVFISQEHDLGRISSLPLNWADCRRLLVLGLNAVVE